MSKSFMLRASKSAVVSANCFSTKAGAQVAPARGRFTDLSGLGPARFYENVEVKKLSVNRFVVTLDGKNLRTPRRSLFDVPSEKLAIAVAAEWDAQSDRIRPSSMPLTTLVSTAKDIVPQFRSQIASSVTRYLHTDTVCIRPESPSELVAFQSRVLDPITSYFEINKGLKLNVVLGSLSAPQSRAMQEYISWLVNGLDCYSLAGLESAASTSKSVVIATALRDGAIDARAAVEACRSEEKWQSSVWGVVEGGHDTSDADTMSRLCAAEVLFKFIEADKDAFGSG